MAADTPTPINSPEHSTAIGAITPKRQISDKQLEANRSNAQKSTGPRTEEGKRESSRNAFRHGLTGQVSVNTDEDRTAHATFTARLISGLKPEGPIEEQLAHSIAENHWRLNRARAMEDNIFALGHYGSAAEIDVDHPELHTALTSAQVFLDRSKDFERLTLYEQRIHRTLEKDMKTLEELQAKRRADRKAALEEAAQRLQVSDFYENEDPNGFEFSNDEIRLQMDRTDRLKRHAYHEGHHWDPEYDYPVDRIAARY